MGRMFGISVPAESRWLRLVRAFCKPILEEVAPGQADRLLLAIDESAANIIKHRCSTLDDGLLTVELDISPDRLRCRFRRFCRASEVPTIRPRALDEVRPGGLGTHFVAQVMDAVHFEQDPHAPEVRSLVLEKILTQKGMEHADGT